MTTPDDFVSKKPTNGTSFGQSITDKISFYGVTPIVQPSGAGQAAAGTTSTATTGFATSTQANAAILLIDAMRTALVNLGAIAGA